MSGWEWAGIILAGAVALPIALICIFIACVLGFLLVAVAMALPDIIRSGKLSEALKEEDSK